VDKTLIHRSFFSFFLLTYTMPKTLEIEDKYYV